MENNKIGKARGKGYLGRRLWVNTERRIISGISGNGFVIIGSFVTAI